MARTAGPIPDRFWPKVDKRGPDECWPWLGTRNQKGYGHFFFSKKAERAHKVAWELANNAAFPTGKHACHTCDNPPCCNPAHIWPGTPSENMRDKVRKNRHPTAHTAAMLIALQSIREGCENILTTDQHPDCKALARLVLADAIPAISKTTEAA